MQTRFANGRTYTMSDDIAVLYDRVLKHERLSRQENIQFADWMNAEMAKIAPKGMLEASIVVRQRMAIVFPRYHPHRPAQGTN